MTSQISDWQSAAKMLSSLRASRDASLCATRTTEIGLPQGSRSNRVRLNHPAVQTSSGISDVRVAQKEHAQPEQTDNPGTHGERHVEPGRDGSLLIRL